MQFSTFWLGAVGKSGVKIKESLRRSVPCKREIGASVAANKAFHRTAPSAQPVNAALCAHIVPSYDIKNFQVSFRLKVLKNPNQIRMCVITKGRQAFFQKTFH